MTVHNRKSWRLPLRLRAVADLIDHRRHADIGSDHGLLLRHLLTTGRIDFGLAVEKNIQPYQNSIAALSGLNAEVVLADGAAGLQNHEVDGISVCGVGGRLAASIVLDRDIVLPKIVLQPNDHAAHVRRRMHAAGYHLTAQVRTQGRRVFDVMRFDHRPACRDPAYAPMAMEDQFELGPAVWANRSPRQRREHQNELAYWGQFIILTPQARRRVTALVSRV